MLVINGSGKFKESNSAYFSELTLSNLDKKTTSIYSNSYPQIDEVISLINTHKTILITTPIYVDGLPSHLLELLVQIEMNITLINGPVNVYLITNCGLYEPHQNNNAIEIVENWASNCHFKLRQAVGISCGEVFGQMKNVPYGKGPTKHLKFALDELAVNINTLSSGKTLLVKPSSVPRFMFIAMASNYWTRVAKKNGLSKKEIC